MSKHILVVDDDDRIRALLHQYLSDQGYRVSAAATADEARQKMDYFIVDALVLDVMMPQETGIEFAQKLGEKAPPILMLTAMGEPQDRIKGLEAGVDDYLVKPFEPRELLLRLQNILQRFEKLQIAKKTVNFGEFNFDLSSGQLRQSGELVYLTSSESHCLKLLAEQAGKPVSRTYLAEMTASGGAANERSVDVQINRLRKKIEQVAGRPAYIQTVRGEGYVLHADGV